MKKNANILIVILVSRDGQKGTSREPFRSYNSLSLIWTDNLLEVLYVSKNKSACWIRVSKNYFIFPVLNLLNDALTTNWNHTRKMFQKSSSLTFCNGASLSSRWTSSSNSMCIPTSTNKSKNLNYFHC